MIIFLTTVYFVLGQVRTFPSMSATKRAEGAQVEELISDLGFMYAVFAFLPFFFSFNDFFLFLAQVSLRLLFFLLISIVL